MKVNSNVNFTAKYRFNDVMGIAGGVLQKDLSETHRKLATRMLNKSTHSDHHFIEAYRAIRSKYPHLADLGDEIQENLYDMCDNRPFNLTLESYNNFMDGIRKAKGYGEYLDIEL